GYRVLAYKINTGEKITNKIIFLYKLVGEYFVHKPSEEHVHLIHMDRKRDNDHYKNLKWVTREEFLDFYKKSPFVQAAKRKQLQDRKKSDGHKLTITQVIRLKKQILDPNRKTRLKILAKQFGV